MPGRDGWCARAGRRGTSGSGRSQASACVPLYGGGVESAVTLNVGLVGGGGPIPNSSASSRSFGMSTIGDVLPDDADQFDQGMAAVKHVGDDEFNRAMSGSWAAQTSVGSNAEPSALPRSPQQAPPSTYAIPLPTAAPTPPPTANQCPPDADAQGWLQYPEARCDYTNPAVAVGHTSDSPLVIGQTRVGRYYYKGYRLAKPIGRADR
jgi:hypothetical protein